MRNDMLYLIKFVEQLSLYLQILPRAEAVEPIRSLFDIC